MKKSFFFAAAFISLFGSSSANAFQHDKKLHFGVSFMLGAGFATQFAPLESCAYATSIGFAKELADSQGESGFSTADLAADLLGSCAGAYLVDYSRRWWE